MPSEILQAEIAAVTALALAEAVPERKEALFSRVSTLLTASEIFNIVELLVTRTSRRFAQFPKRRRVT